MDGLAAQLRQWTGGIDYELTFWRRWLDSRGDRWPQDFAARMDPARPLEPRFVKLLQGRGPKVRVLDVGAGPVTSLGARAAGLDVELVPTDPLAHHYAALCAAAGVAPPTPTRFALAEELEAFFPEGGFDLVHCRNALDHSADPIRGIAQMLAVTRPGGHVVLIHHRNEAERERYAGFHQWNFDVRADRFVIWNHEEEMDVESALPTPHRMTVRGGEMVDIVIEKTGETPPAARSDPAERLRAWLAAFVTEAAAGKG